MSDCQDEERIALMQEPLYTTLSDVPIEPGMPLSEEVRGLLIMSQDPDKAGSDVYITGAILTVVMNLERRINRLEGSIQTS